MTTPLVQKFEDWFESRHRQLTRDAYNELRAIQKEVAEALAGREGCGACGGDQAAQCSATGCRLTDDSPDADGLPDPWALYVGTHEDEHGKVTAMVEVFGEHSGLKRRLFTAEQMLAFRPTPSRAGGGEVGDGWISVKDRLPDFTNWNKTSSGEVAIQNDRGEVMCAEWAFNSYASSARGKVPRWERCGRIYQGIVTHWQKLPAALNGAGARGGEG
jgi:hypothetical protein